MFLKEAQMLELVRSIFMAWKTQGGVQFKVTEAKALEAVMEVLRQDQQQLLLLDKEARQMVDQLGAQAGVDPHKMFLMLRQRLAKQKGIIL